MSGGWLLAGYGLGYGLLVLAYLSGWRVARLRRLPDWELRPGRPLPEAVQSHVLAGLAGGLLFLLAGLSALSGAAAPGLPLPALAAAALAVLTGAVRLLLGGSGRPHLVAVLAAAPVLLAHALLLLR